MLKEASKLKSLIGQLIALSPERLQDLNNLTETITGECQRVKAAVYEIFKSEPNEAVAAWDVNNFHAELIRLSNLVTEKLKWEEQQHVPDVASPEGEVEPLAYALYCLTDMLNFSETCFRGIVSSLQPVPRFCVIKMKELLQSRWPAVEEGLRKKRITPWMIREISSGLNALVKRTYPAITYRDYDYLQVFLSELARRAADARRKNWEQRLIYFLNHFNFNHMGFFNHWAASFRKKLEASATSEERKKLIDSTKHQFTHTTVLKGLAFDPDSDSLRAHILSFLAEQRSLTISRSSTPSPGPVKLKTLLSADDLSVEFHYRFRLNLYNYKTRKEAASDFAAVHSSSQTEDVSAHSIARFDKKKLFPAAVKYHRILLAMDEEIMRDFGLRRKESD